MGEPTGGKPNAPYDERWSLAPEIYTSRTFAQYIGGDDPAIDAVLAYPNT